MATSTQIAASSTAPAVITESMQRLLQVRDLWTRSQKDQLEIGRLLYEERKERLGVGGGSYSRDGFHEWLREAGVPKTSGYRRIAEYEISIGERTEDDSAYRSQPVPNGTPQCAQCRGPHCFKYSEVGEDIHKRVPVYLCESCIEPYILAGGHAVFINAHQWSSGNPALSVSRVGGETNLWGRASLEEAAKNALNNAKEFLQDVSTKLPNYANELREELQNRNLLTPELDTKLTRAAQSATETTVAPAVITDAVNFPTAPKTWTHADEKRTNRSEPLASEDAVVTLALKVIDAGYKALKDSEDPSHLHAAVRLAKLSLTSDEVLQ